MGSMEVHRRLDPWGRASLSDMWRDSLLFRYLARTGAPNANGDGVPADALSLHGGTIRSLASSDAR